MLPADLRPSRHRFTGPDGRHIWGYIIKKASPLGRCWRDGTLPPRPVVAAPPAATAPAATPSAATSETSDSEPDPEMPELVPEEGGARCEPFVCELHHVAGLLASTQLHR